MAYSRLLRQDRNNRENPLTTDSNFCVDVLNATVQCAYANMCMTCKFCRCIQSSFCFALSFFYLLSYIVCSVVAPPTGGANNGSQRPRTRTQGTNTQANSRTPERRRTTAGRTDEPPTNASQPGTAEAGTHTQRGDHQRHTGRNGEEAGRGKNREPRGETGADGRGRRTNSRRRSRTNTSHHSRNTKGRQATATTPSHKPQAAKTTPSQPPNTNHAPNTAQPERKTEEENRKNNTRNTPKKHKKLATTRTGTEPRRSSPHKSSRTP